MRPLHLSLLSFHTFPPSSRFELGVCVYLHSLLTSSYAVRIWMQMGEGSHSISALLNSCTIFLLRGYCSRLWCEILEGRGGEYNLYSSKALHSYRNCLWQGKKRKEKWKPTAARGTRSYSGGTVILPISCRTLFGSVESSTCELINSKEQRPSSEADSSSHIHEILHVLWNPKVHYRVLESLPMSWVRWTIVQYCIRASKWSRVVCDSTVIFRLLDIYGTLMTAS